MELHARVATLKAELARRAGAGTRGRFTDALRAETLAVLAARRAPSRRGAARTYVYSTPRSPGCGAPRASA